MNRDATKDSILKAIVDGGWGSLSSNAIQEQLQIDQRVISQCLCKLHKQGIVGKYKLGRQVIWTFKPQ